MFQLEILFYYFLSRFRSTKNFAKKYNLELTAATFLIVAHSDARSQHFKLQVKIHYKTVDRFHIDFTDADITVVLKEQLSSRNCKNETYFEEGLIVPNVYCVVLNI